VTDTRDPKTELGFDPDALHARYMAERDKRLRPDGMGQYVQLHGEFEAYSVDPRAEQGFTRPPLTDLVDVAIVGGGFSGLIAAGRLRQAGVKDIRIIEKGADFGGTWYWNRYPGIRCDVEAYIYMPFLEELGYIPTEKYAGGDEIFAHCQAVARKFDLYSNACLQTQVTSINWDAEAARWVIHTNRDDAMKAKFVCLAGGILLRPKLPGIPGIHDYQGHSFHSSRWDYAYTGGDAKGNLTGLRGKRVGIIGTGATAIQCVPHLAATAEQLVVFQRTPSTVDIRANRPTDPDWAASLEPGWQRKRMENFTAIVSGIKQEEDLVSDRWTDVWGRLWTRPAGMTEGIDPAELMQLADYEKMEDIRARVDEIVTDKATAEALKPWYNLFCKRPLYSDEFLQVFNQPNVTLVDTQGRGVDRITAKGAVFDGVEYELDCLIYATGFTAGLPPFQAGEYKVIGRDGLNLEEQWATGMRSLHGLMTHGFPNLFVQGHTRQAALSVNVPHALGAQANHAAAVIKWCLDEGVRTVEPRPEAEDAWAATLKEKAIDRAKYDSECTPGYFNNEGQPGGGLADMYGAGPLDYMDVLDKWRAERLQDDLETTYE
jgi:cation diffusion facilitator CzcD-associated flavoprotein CzcO